MTKDQATTERARIGIEATKTACATGGLLAAFGVASCCALPVALGALGLGSTSLLGVAMLVGPYQIQLLAAAVVCLLVAGTVMWQQHRARAAPAACAPPNPVAQWVATASIGLALGLIGFTFWIEPPL